MHVLTVGNMYPPHHQGGYETVWRDAVEGLRSRGHDVAVLTTDHREPGVAGAAEPGVHRELRWYWRDHAFQRPGLAATLALERHNARRFACRSRDADLVMWWPMGGMSLSLVSRAAAPSMAVVHDAWPLYGPQFDRFTARWGRFARRRWDPARVDWWSFNSAYTRDQMARGGLALDPARCSVESPGIDPARFPPAPPRPWGWRLAVVGRLDPRKGVATAIDALRGLPVEATLTVAGAGDEAHAADLRARARERGVAERVRFLGAVADPTAVYAEADAVVFPVQWQEPWGLVPLEAMAVGRPVLATGTGGTAEFLRDGGNCLRFAPGDVGALAAAVQRLAGDAALRERLIAAGAATAAAHTQAAFVASVCDRAEAVAGL